MLRCVAPNERSCYAAELGPGEKVFKEAPAVSERPEDTEVTALFVGEQGSTTSAYIHLAPLKPKHTPQGHDTDAQRHVNCCPGGG
mmetsp:Transcript_56245/g.122259  ORF Transcript_56245/g.122259 Transcript_56245/m.122259 type:complete len:85 (+) Transcript_56245:1077-1331(+)